MQSLSAVNIRRFDLVMLLAEVGSWQQTHPKLSSLRNPNARAVRHASQNLF